MECLIVLLWVVHATSGVVGHPAEDVRSKTEGDFPVSEAQYEVTGNNKSENFPDLLLHQPPALLIASNFTSYDHLQNFHDFSAWNKEDIHEFDLNYENEVLGDEYTYLDQLAVESEQNVTKDLPYKSQANLTNQNVNQYNQGTQNKSLLKPVNMDLFVKNVQVNSEIFEAGKSVHLIRTENKDPEVKDDTVRLQSSKLDTTEGIYSDNPYKVEDIHEDEEDESQGSILEDENRQNEILLNQFQERFENNPKSLSTIFRAPHKDIEYPLISILKMDPYSVRLMVKPKTYDIYTMVRLMYERVPLSKPALPQHLDDPVIEYVPMYRGEQEHRLYNLPVGKYIVCGEAMVNGNVFQSNCVEAHVDKNSSKMLQGGVICVIAVAMLIVFSVIVYAIYHRLVIYKLEQKS